MADYQYTPIYGVEPWQDNAGVGTPTEYGGGAKITGQNLIISMWTTEATPRLLVPLPYTPDAVTYDAFAPGYGTKGSLPAFNSRTSARFQIGLNDIEFTLLAVLNPPNDFKSQVQNAFKADASAANGFAVLKSFQQPLAFEAYATDGKNGLLQCPAVFGGPIAFTSLLATSGADGTPPVALPSLFSGLPAAQDTLNAMNSGNFYIGCEFELRDLIGDPEDSGIVTINWPHTAARG